MSSRKRFAFLVALVAVLAVGWSVPGEAQGRRGARGRTVIVTRGYYADPFFYGYPWFGYQYPFGPYGYPYPYGYRYGGPESAVRLEVTPREAEVFIDGYYAGIVDDFDGAFQRLRVEPGEHDITLYREGFKTVHQKVYLTVDSTFRVKYTMEKLGAGETAEARPTPKEPPPDAGVASQPSEPGPPPFDAPARRGVTSRRVPPPPPAAGGSRVAESSAYGTLAIRVQPGNATVLIDGERWDGPADRERLVVELSEGTHRLQIQREGFDPFSTEVTIRRGETTPLNVSLRTR